MAHQTTIALADVSCIDKNIIYRDFENNSSPYTYVMKVLDLNRERLQDLFGVVATIDYDTKSVHFCGETQENILAAVQRTIFMLKEPVYNLRVDPAFVVALRILKEVKKDFSAQTGCWLHFIWVSRTVSCYGIDGTAASQYLNNVIEVVRRCIKSPKGYNGCVVAERQCDRRYKNLLKRYVDYVESESGAKMAIKKDDLPSGMLTLQFYGTVATIANAMEVLASTIFSNPPDKAEAPKKMRQDSSAAFEPVETPQFMSSSIWSPLFSESTILSEFSRTPSPFSAFPTYNHEHEVAPTQAGGDEETLALLLAALKERPDVKYPTIASFIRQSGVDVLWVVQLLQLLNDLNVSTPQAIGYLSKCE